MSRNKNYFFKEMYSKIVYYFNHSDGSQGSRRELEFPSPVTEWRAHKAILEQHRSESLNCKGFTVIHTESY